MNSLFDRLQGQGAVLTDGAWGTELQTRGLAIASCPDVWNVTNPEIVAQVAGDYLSAGSQILLTNTFGSNAVALERHGLERMAREINLQGAAISIHAAANRACVFGSIGPTGKMLDTGQVTLDQAYSAFADQALALAEGGVDGLVIETMSDLAEASVALSAARETALPVVVCMTYGTRINPNDTSNGTTPEQSVDRLISEGAHAIGSNCGIGAAPMLPVCRRLKAAAGRVPVWIKPNAGLPRLVDGRAVYSILPVEFANAAVRLVQAGAAFIGGCCGTNPEYIVALNAALAAPHNLGECD